MIDSAPARRIEKLVKCSSSLLATSLHKRECSERGPDWDLSEVYFSAQFELRKSYCAGSSAKCIFISVGLDAKETCGCAEEKSGVL